MNIVPYKAEHISMINVQQVQVCVIPEGYAKAIEGKWAFTVMAGDMPIACGGVQEVYEGRGIAWAYIDKDAGQYFVGIHKIVRTFFKLCPLRRIEATVDMSFEQGQRWMKMLGLKQEGVMRSYYPNGNDAILYSIVKNV